MYHGIETKIEGTAVETLMGRAGYSWPARGRDAPRKALEARTDCTSFNEGSQNAGKGGDNGRQTQGIGAGSR